MDENQRPGVVKWARSFWDRTKDALYIGGVVAGILVGVVEWYRANFPDTEPATTQDVNQGVDAIVSEVQRLDSTVVFYQDSLRLERARYDSLMQIGFGAVADLQKRMGKVESHFVSMRMDMFEGVSQVKQGTDQLIEEVRRQASAEERAKAEAERRAEEEKEADRLWRQAVSKKLKIEQPQKF
jgi:hypothetical protein